MRRKVFTIWIATVAFFPAWGQEPALAMESADVTTEEYTDDFQEHFFEALKQKGIENYQRAAEELLRCKKLDAGNEVVDYELGRVYIKLRQYDRAEAHLLHAVEKKAELWYLDALFGLYELQGEIDKAVAVGERLARSDSQYKENLVRIFMDAGRYEDALLLIKELNAELGRSELRERQQLWMETRMNPGTVIKTGEETVKDTAAEGGVSESKDNLEETYRRIGEYKKIFNFGEVLALAERALEDFPAQPALYYHKATALNRLKKHGEALEVLQAALDYLIDDRQLENDIYREFVIAYNSLGNDRKAEEYAGKIRN
ncbi:tetratricopeptide repeat protein [Sinomicrobium soli]|uniref:tetratricopeptide repeat protein n=1 Tax=Sinomicrobium sp. N-1-3-6 TaxID=2219864 RepID=UPI0011BDAA13|nr:hypothetical protein [Sinomicrobium sp. N-1-3-6]